MNAQTNNETTAIAGGAIAPVFHVGAAVDAVLPLLSETIAKMAGTDTLAAKVNRSREGAYIKVMQAAAKAHDAATWKAAVAEIDRQYQHNVDGKAVKAGLKPATRGKGAGDLVLYALPESWKVAKSTVGSAFDAGIPMTYDKAGTFKGKAVKAGDPVSYGSIAKAMRAKRDATKATEVKATLKGDALIIADIAERCGHITTVAALVDPAELPAVLDYLTKLLANMRAMAKAKVATTEKAKAPKAAKAKALAKAA